MTAKRELDAQRSGLGLIDILFGLVLAEAFLQTSRNGVDGWSGWSHLSLAVTLIVLSWVGYHNSRRHYAWALQFFNLPLAQYIVDVFIVTAYWALVITIEGGADTWDLFVEASIMPEAVLITIIFFLYFAWDTLEICINEDPTYTKALRHGLRDNPQARRAIDARLAGWIPGEGRPSYRADVTRSMRAVTLFFFVLYLVAAAILVCLTPHEPVHIALADGIYAGTLVTYRALQTKYGDRAADRRDAPLGVTSNH